LSETKVLFWDEAVSLILPAFMFVCGNSTLTISSIASILLHWLLIVMIGSFAYSLFAFSNGHHGPNIVHEGDEIESMDYGAFQVRANVERAAINGNDFTVMAYYGQHTLHHLFPTLDHSILPQLEEIYAKTCEQFSIVPNKKTSIINAMSDQFEQLGRTVTMKIN
jgi:fatty acid desaturase